MNMNVMERHLWLPTALFLNCIQSHFHGWIYAARSKLVRFISLDIFISSLCDRYGEMVVLNLTSIYNTYLIIIIVATIEDGKKTKFGALNNMRFEYLLGRTVLQTRLRFVL